jgi:hypothetical protein
LASGLATWSSVQFDRWHAILLREHLWRLVAMRLPIRHVTVK